MINDFQVSDHFNLREFQCPCCYRVKIEDKLVRALEALRGMIGCKPIIVTSGYRCANHNKMVGGAIDSDHLYGWAADIIVKGVPREVVIEAAEELSGLIKRIGTYEDRDCIHIGCHGRLDEGLPWRWGP